MLLLLNQRLRVGLDIEMVQIAIHKDCGGEFIIKKGYCEPLFTCNKCEKQMELLTEDYDPDEIEWQNLATTDEE